MESERRGADTQAESNAHERLYAAAAELMAGRESLEDTPPWRPIARRRLRRKVQRLQAGVDGNRRALRR
jgi:hypothetical protein